MPTFSTEVFILSDNVDSINGHRPLLLQVCCGLIQVSLTSKVFRGTSQAPRICFLAYTFKSSKQ